MRDIGEQTIALTADVAEGHALVPMDEPGWYLLGCQIQLGSSFHVGVALHLLFITWCVVHRTPCSKSGNSASTWHMLVADDFHVDASGAGDREALITFFLVCATCKVPLSWNQTAGGNTVMCVGFEFLLKIP